MVGAGQQRLSDPEFMSNWMDVLAAFGVVAKIADRFAKRDEKLWRS